jgi:uncharacterized caspase-like protein
MSNCKFPLRIGIVGALLVIVIVSPRPAAAQPIKSGTSYALLVACDKYDEKQLKSLKFTRNDIIGLHNILIESGYKADNIIAMYDRWSDSKGGRLDLDPLLPQCANIRRKLKQLVEKVGEKDELIVALSGHGVQFRGETKHYYCPCDADLDDRSTLIDLSEVYRMLATCPCKRKLLLVDACRNDPRSNLSRSSRPAMELESVTRPQEDKIPEGLVALFSCSEGQESMEDPELQHGIFFYQLMKGWHQGAVNVSGQLQLSELVRYATRETTQYAQKRFQAKQIPEQKNEFADSWVLTQYIGEIRRLWGRYRIHTAHVSHNGQWVVACTMGTKNLSEYLVGEDPQWPELFIYDAVSGILLKRWSIHVGLTWDMVCTRDGRHAYISGDDGTIRMWDLENGKEIARFRSSEKAYDLCLALSNDEKLLASSADDNIIRVWDAETGELLTRAEGHSDRIHQIEFAPNSMWFASASSDGTVRLWRASDGKELRRFQHADNLVLGASALAISPDGKWVVSGGPQKHLRVWDVDKDQMAGEYAIHAQLLLPTYGKKPEEKLYYCIGARAIRFNPQGDQVISGGADKTICIWNWKTGKVINRVRMMDEFQCEMISVSPDGRRLLMAGRDQRRVVQGGRDIYMGSGVVRIWAIPQFATEAR